MRILNLLQNLSKYLRSRKSCRKASIILRYLQKATTRSLIVYLHSLQVHHYLVNAKITTLIHRNPLTSVKALFRVCNKKNPNKWGRSHKRCGGTARRGPNTIKAITKINNTDRATKDYKLWAPG